MNVYKKLTILFSLAVWLIPTIARSQSANSFIMALEDRVDTSLSTKDYDLNDFVMHINSYDMGFLASPSTTSIDNGLVSIKPIMAAGEDETYLKITNFCIGGDMEYRIHNASSCVANNNNGMDFSIEPATIAPGTLTPGQSVRVSRVSDLFPNCPNTSMINLTSQTTDLCEGRTVIIAWECTTNTAPQIDWYKADYSEFFVLENATEGIDISSSTSTGGLPGVAMFSEDIHFPTEGTSLLDAFNFEGVTDSGNVDCDIDEKNINQIAGLSNDCKNALINTMSDPDPTVATQAKRRIYVDVDEWHEELDNHYVRVKETGSAVGQIVDTQYTDSWNKNSLGDFYYETCSPAPLTDADCINPRVNNSVGISITSDQYRFTDFSFVYDERQDQLQALGMGTFHASYPSGVVGDYANPSQSTQQNCSHFDNGFTFDNTPTP